MSLFEQLNTINELSKALSNAKKCSRFIVPNRINVGSDIYLDYSVSSSLSVCTQQFAVTVERRNHNRKVIRYETGYSKPRVGEDYLSIEEALLSALSNTISRLMTYWKMIYIGHSIYSHYLH